MKTVLVLHGYGQNAVIIGKRLAALRKECSSKNVELVFVNAPNILQPADLAGQSWADNLVSLGAGEAAGAQDPSLLPRSWWQSNEDKTVAVGLSKSIESIRDLLRTRRFDGVLGFSQGAAFAAFLSALLERPHLCPSFLVDGKAPHPPFEFCIAVSGFRMGDLGIQHIFDLPFSTYTLHVIGRNDVIVAPESSRKLTQMSSNNRVEEHDGGHFVPSKGPWRKFLAEFMKNPFAEIPSPSSSATGGSDNGTALMMKL